MSSTYNRMKQKFLDIVSHCIPYMPCLSYQSSAAFEYGCVSSELINEMFVFFEELHVFFPSSTKR